MREYQDMVFGSAVRLLGNPAEAEDVAQTVFLRAFERFNEVKSNPGQAGWLKTVTTNLCLNFLIYLNFQTLCNRAYVRLLAVH